ncbi:hypothetical protein J6590_025380 [Homalodisca vitripennis]|nr:hypothetical protein J6590_025380 [Homalodisca vitripennis]
MPHINAKQTLTIIAKQTIAMSSNLHTSNLFHLNHRAHIPTSIVSPSTTTTPPPLGAPAVIQSCRFRRSITLCLEILGEYAARVPGG